MRIGLRASLPLGHILAVGVARAGEVGPVGHHTAAQGVITRGHGTPAAAQRAKDVPQLRGVEGSRGGHEAARGIGQVCTRQVAAEAIDVGGGQTLFLLQEAPIHSCLVHHLEGNVLRAIAYHRRDAERLAPAGHVVEGVSEQVAVNAGSPGEAHVGGFLLHQVAVEYLLKCVGRGGTHLLQRGAAGLLPHALAHGLRIGKALGRDDAAQSATALDDGAMHQALGQFGGEQGLYAACPGALTEKGHVGRIATEDLDVAMDPAEGLHLVEKAVIARALTLALGREQGMSQESAHTEAVVDGDEDDVASGEGGAVKLHLIAVAVLIGSAVYPDHHGQLVAPLGLGRLPDIEVEAILAHRGCLTLIELPPVERALLLAALQRGSAPGVASAHTLPRLHRLRGLPAQVAHGRGGIGNPLVHDDVRSIRLHAFYLSAIHREYSLRLL